MPVRKRDKIVKGFQISQFYPLFSSDIKAVKGLNLLLSINYVSLSHLQNCLVYLFSNFVFDFLFYLSNSRWASAPVVVDLL